MTQSSAGSSPVERLTARVVGRVQGVGYRCWLLARAVDAGLTGWVMNHPDEPSVELVAEGPRPVLDELERDLWRGPRGARVDAVEATRAPASGEFSRFAVTRL